MWGASKRWGTTRNQRRVGAGGGIILIAGQSNAVGQANAADMGGGWSESYQHVQMYQRYSLPPPGLNWIDVTGNLAPYSGSAPNMGVELSLGKKLYAQGHNPMIAKVGQGTTSLAVDWAPGGTLFNDMCNYAESLMASTGRNVEALVWIQGETDTTSGTWTSNYGTNLSAFMAAVRARLGSGMKVIIVELNDVMPLNATNINTIQAAQASYVAGDPNSALVSVTGLTSPSGDNHYNAADMVTLGERIADSFMALFGITARPVTRDSHSLVYLPATNTEATRWLSGLTGSPANPTVIYNFQGGGTDANGTQNLTVGSGWTWTAPTGWSRYGATSADNNANALASTAGPFGDPYTASHLAICIMVLTAAPAATRDLMGFGGAGAYRGVQITSARKLGFYDLGATTLTEGTATYAVGTPYMVALQFDRTNNVSRVITFNATTGALIETINATHNEGGATSLLFTVGYAVAAAGPVKIPWLAGWRGANAEMSSATITAIAGRLVTGYV